MHSLSRVHRWHVATLAPAQNGGKSREKVREKEGRLPRVWKLNGAGSVYLAGVQLKNNNPLPARRWASPTSMPGPYHLLWVRSSNCRAKSGQWSGKSAVASRSRRR